jgi:hypothetical protein
MEYFAGLDVSVKDTSVCIVDDTGKIVREVKVARLRLFHLILESHHGSACVPIPKRGMCSRATSTPSRWIV